MTAVEQFHEHLERCVRCATSPFDLCPVGQRLLEQAGGAPEPAPRKPAKA